MRSEDGWVQCLGAFVSLFNSFFLFVTALLQLFRNATAKNVVLIVVHFLSSLSTVKFHLEWSSQCVQCTSSKLSSVTPVLVIARWGPALPWESDLHLLQQNHHRWDFWWLMIGSCGKFLEPWAHVISLYEAYELGYDTSIVLVQYGFGVTWYHNLYQITIYSSPLTLWCDTLECDMMMVLGPLRPITAAQLPRLTGS